MRNIGLVDYFERWEDIEEQPIPDSDRQEIEHFIGRLIGHAIQMLFNQQMASAISPPLRRVGGFMLEEVFNRLCLNLYKQYRTFFTHAQYEKVINDYINAMQSMTLKERRGHIALNNTKEALARRFGLSSVATFENRLESEYADLTKKVEWTGRGDQSQAVIKLCLHPLEDTILSKLRSSNDQRDVDGRTTQVLNSNEIAALARNYGYRDEETLLALQLLMARGYTRFDPSAKIVYLSQIGPDPHELNGQLMKLADSLDKAEGLLEVDFLSKFKQDVNKLREQLDHVQQDDAEELDELQTRISDLGQRFENLLSSRREEYRKQINQLVLDIERNSIALKGSSVLDREIQGQVAFVMHLNELRQTLAQKQRELISQYNALKTNLTIESSNAGGGPITEMQQLYRAQRSGEQKREQLAEQKQALESQSEHLKIWTELLKDTDRLFNTLSRLPDLRDQLTHQVVPEVQAHLTKRRLDGLGDWELFRSKVNSVEDELEKRRRHGNETFNEVKEEYEKVLRDMNIGDYRPRARYTYGEDVGSYDDLYEEVKSKVERRLNEIAVDLSREQTDLLKAQYITIVSDENLGTVQK